jgi:nitrite reductase/ring-hydroxylating ferredoxin subunit
MELDRRTVVAGALVISAAALVGLPAHATEFNLGKATAIKIGAAKIFSVGQSRVLIYRSSSQKFLGYTAVCPVDKTPLALTGVSGSRITCSKDKIAFSLTTGKPTSKVAPLASVKVRLQNGFVLATVAVAASPTPTQTAAPSTAQELIETSKVPASTAVKVNTSIGPVMIIQVQRGSYIALSAVCTHAGCEVADANASTLGCGCHGAIFDKADGSVLQGPAKTPLKRYDLVEREGLLFFA